MYIEIERACFDLGNDILEDQFSADTCRLYMGVPGGIPVYHSILKVAKVMVMGFWGRVRQNHIHGCSNTRDCLCLGNVAETPRILMHFVGLPAVEVSRSKGHGDPLGAMSPFQDS